MHNRTFMYDSKKNDSKRILMIQGDQLYLTDVQPDQINMVVCFWYYVKSDLSSIL